MSTKPTQLPRWATAATPDPATQPAPGAGKQDVGWKTGERPPAYYQNWLQYWNYKWAEYLNDGALQGAHTFDSTVGVTGLITAGAGVTAAANQHFTVSGTGDYKHGDRVLLIDGSSALAINNFSQTVWNTAEWEPDSVAAFRTKTTSAFSAIRVPIPLNVGDRIKQAIVRFSSTNASATISNISLIVNSVSTAFSSSISAPISGSEYTFTVGSPVALTSHAFMTIAINGSLVGLHYAKITYDRP